LWGELPEADARNNLRVSLSKLRQHLDEYLHITHETVAFNESSPHWLDVQVFDKGIRNPGEETILRQAMTLYKGDFLQELYIRDAPVFEDWVTQQRNRLHNQAIQGWFRLAQMGLAEGKVAAAIDDLHRLLEHQSWHEEAHQELMRALALSGQRTAALAQFERCRHILQRELGVQPGPATQALFEQIRNGTLLFPSTNNPKTHQQATPQPNQPSPPPAEMSTFIVGPPISHPDHFFGREREVRRILNLLKRLPLQNAAIIGPRRSGKTSLLHFLPAITAAASPRSDQLYDWPSGEPYTWVFADFQDPRLGTRDGFLRHLLSQMNLPTPEPCTLETFMNTVADQMKGRTVILLDEIGVALGRYPELDEEFWESLRSLATNQVGGRLGFILASDSQPGELAAAHGLGSPFFNIFGYTAHLGPLPENEAHALIASSPRPFPTDDIAWIMQESGRWPILLQLLCRERLLAYEEGDTTTHWRTEAQQQMIPYRYLLTMVKPMT
jgi:DNA-binding SARP family transcriptional activator